jgi:5-hydroxyisourate hydrolase-like protein (transthyretin family)
VNTYPHLMEDIVAGNTDRLTGQQIHAQAMPIIKSHLGKPRDLAIESYQNHSNTDRTMSEISEIVAAAHSGRIDKLLVHQSATLPGEYSPANQTVDYNVSTTDHCRDLIEQTIAQTLLHRGEVYPLPENEMPADKLMVAMLRY